MDKPFRRRFRWWQIDSEMIQAPKVYKWKKGKWIHQDTNKLPFPPPPFLRLWLGDLVSEPFAVYVLGVLAALSALVITSAMVDGRLIAAVLAPVMAVLGAFTGHAAGHSSAVRVMREGRASPQAPPPAPSQGDVDPSAGQSSDPTQSEVSADNVEEEST
jgi:hypothetical protein